MGGKSFCYEAAMRVPLIVKWPRAVAPGRRESARTIAVDFAATFLELAEAPYPPKTSFNGVSLMALLTGAGRPAARGILFHHPHYTHAAGPFSSVIVDDWKLVRFYSDSSGAEQLFDLAADPYEQDDLAATRPVKASELRQLLDNWLLEVDAEMPTGNVTYDPAAPPVTDRRFTWELALKERAEHERKWRASCRGG